jgi:hypothetical protein
VTLRAERSSRSASFRKPSLVSLRAIVGEVLHYLVFWTTATSTVTLIGVFSALGAPLSRMRLGPARSFVGPTVLAGALAFAVTATSFQAQWLARNPALPGSYPGMRPKAERVYAALVQRLARDGATPIVHLEGDYAFAQTMVLELEKDGVDVRAAEVDRWNFTGMRSPADAPRPLHVWFSAPHVMLTNPGCLERVVEVQDSVIYASAVAPERCAPSR